MDQQASKSRKYRFQVVAQVKGNPPNWATNGRSYKRWKSRNTEFQIIDSQTGKAPDHCSNGGLFGNMKDAKTVARELNITRDGRKERKSTRLKIVYSTFDAISEIWAKQSQVEARCRNGQFVENKIWSYGQHYLAGELVKFNGQLVALVNGTYWSRTTSGHTSAIESDAKKAGALVLKFVPESNRTFGDKPDKSVKCALATMRADFQKQFAEVMGRAKYFRWNDFQELERDQEPSWMDSNICREGMEFNRTCAYLGLTQYRIQFSQAEIDAFNIHVKLQFERDREIDARAQVRLLGI